VDLPFFREYDLPWTADAGQERKFQRLLGGIFLGVIEPAVRCFSSSWAT
jgi:hypothetical protein